MKSQHRHELKTNVLAEWLVNFPHWFKENLNMVIYVAVGLVIIAVVSGYFWYIRNVQVVVQMTEFTNTVLGVDQLKMRVINDQIRGSDSSYVLLDSANQLEMMAQNAREDGMAALGFIKNAELIRTELHYRSRVVDKAAEKRQINNAKKRYSQAIVKSASIPSLKASAQYGLGLCEEELGNFDEARKIYDEITNTEEFEGTTAAYQAKQRLEQMENYLEPVAFQPRPLAPEPIIPEVTTPDIDIPGLDIVVKE
ncbi:MAG: tetratricopeptide repeat protein, partial [Planctomycetota bacterium]